MLCNAIHLNPDFLQIEHLDKLSQAQDISGISYHNYLPLLCATTLQTQFRKAQTFYELHSSQ